MEVTKGGVFAPADMQVIRRALDAYMDKMLALPNYEPDPDDINKVANLQHRLGRINKK